ncbi:FxsA family protein [Salinicola avicenniae]|uniref:FxsA family protein n=1 Tax=Salinicola avicenniae TaxID=2916836 RepID=UPI002072FA88|nr:MULTISPECIES: FxsA family protein [unclassified Salinicola]
MPLLFLLTLFAIVDFITLFTFGAKLGWLLSLAWIVGSAAFGLHLIRRESLLTLQRARERMNLGQMPSNELLAGASFVLAGLLLLAPGFLSDLFGVLALLPGSGSLASRWFGKRPTSRQSHHGADDWQTPPRDDFDTGERRRVDGDPLEGDYLGKDRP